MYNPNLYYPPAFTPGYKTGGNVASQQKYGLAAAAEELRSRGRGDDTVLAHITPDEAGILKLLGGSGEINPNTGLPEFGFLKELKKLVSNPVDYVERNVVSPVVKEVKNVGRQIDDVVNDAIPGGWGTVAAITAAVVAPQFLSNVSFAPEAAAASAGSAGAGAGAGAGIAAFDYAPIGFNTGVASASAAAPAAGIAAFDYAPVGFNTGVGGTGAGNAAAIAGGDGLAGYDLNYSIPGASPATSAAAPVGIASTTLPGTSAGATGAGPSTAGSFANLASAAAKAMAPTSTQQAINMALLGTTGYGAVTAAKETKEQRELAERELARQAAKKAADIRNAELVMERNPYRFGRLTAADVRRYGIGMPKGYEPPPTVQVASGGRIDSSFDDEPGYDYASGGISSLPPRYLRGGGDGMSDSIPARIGGKQEARLADGEFVIPADVVSHLGNGSSNAGAKKLYAMMDRIRKARTGKTRQAPAVKTNRLMPA